MQDPHSKLVQTCSKHDPQTSYRRCAPKDRPIHAPTEQPMVSQRHLSTPYDIARGFTTPSRSDSYFVYQNKFSWYYYRVVYSIYHYTRAQYRLICAPQCAGASSNAETMVSINYNHPLANYGREKIRLQFSTQPDS